METVVQFQYMDKRQMLILGKWQNEYGNLRY